MCRAHEGLSVPTFRCAQITDPVAHVHRTLKKARFALEPVSAHRARGIHFEAAAEHGPLKTHGAALPDDGAKSSREHHDLLIYDDVRLRPGTRGTCAPLFDEQVPPNPSNRARRKRSRWKTRGAATSNRTRPCPTSVVFTSPRLPPSGTRSAGSARSA